jgi:hypothetical protein
VQDCAGLEVSSGCISRTEITDAVSSGPANRLKFHSTAVPKSASGRCARLASIGPKKRRCNNPSSCRRRLSESSPKCEWQSQHIPKRQPCDRQPVAEASYLPKNERLLKWRDSGAFGNQPGFTCWARSRQKQCDKGFPKWDGPLWSRKQCRHALASADQIARFSRLLRIVRAPCHVLSYFPAQNSAMGDPSMLKWVVRLAAGVFS